MPLGCRTARVAPGLSKNSSQRGIMNKLILSSFLAIALISNAYTAGAAGKTDGSHCHVSKSCRSHLCVRVNPADKFGVCCTAQSCASLGAQCGTAADGCGTPLNCGPCDF